MTAENSPPAARSRIPRRPSVTHRPSEADGPPHPSVRRASAASEDAVHSVAAALKPRMRGWLHAGVFPLALAGGVVLITVARSAAAVAACSVYALSACLLFGTSALYHRVAWGPRGESVLRRLDHANIFLIIAGSYTPLAVLLLPAGEQRILLVLVWGGAVAGIAFRVFWLGAPRRLYTLCYIALGWAAVFYLPGFAHAGGTTVAVLVVVGGLLYTAGATVYGLKRPDPWPRWFGFHEVFHLLTIAAFTAHYTAIFLGAT
ncbi:PAQR family membrane homeostasis protein TrhA [Streptomyces physcomitrii]|nr:hemolysin III family protein [Streptomyces physcomitrii]